MSAAVGSAPPGTVGAAMFRVDKGNPDAVELAAVVAVLCARVAAPAAAVAEDPAQGPAAAHWPRRVGGGRPAAVGWSGGCPGGAWRPGL
ncbi:acyl-CoA carboxylase epsilon subunit [Streptomyces sp. B-S-A8]|uniref:Acyl-CoA carboxylase epsilon subunit n=1 Tax=Streptomyces solicavernae TaxID=3043614 RepID=A0ABT6S0K9_9ACTN|nr:acyl-CoA carboxylase epsilon subunit [Streptomyces sp. B-S-A8]MDI3389964.1 acyl-CoA carboxylase epsilon subunit [Streptomyces sp. B-S-A8]